jgi:hypothetical protein
MILGGTEPLKSIIKQRATFTATSAPWTPEDQAAIKVKANSDAEPMLLRERPRESHKKAF